MLPLLLLLLALPVVKLLPLPLPLLFLLPSLLAPVTSLEEEVLVAVATVVAGAFGGVDLMVGAVAAVAVDVVVEVDIDLVNVAVVFDVVVGIVAIDLGMSLADTGSLFGRSLTGVMFLLASGASLDCGFASFLGGSGGTGFAGRSF